MNRLTWAARVVLVQVAMLGCVLVACAAPAGPIRPPARPTPASPPPAQPAPVDVPFVSITAHDRSEAATLNGAGGTFPAPLYATWFAAYEKQIGVQIVYRAIGSAGGIRAISEQQVDFGASDAPMTDDQLAQAKGGTLLHVPMALGAIVLTYNLPGVSTPLHLTPDTLAAIYQGTIRRWDDPRLVADNPELAVAPEDIVTVHRADGSGTTFGFSDYLSAVSRDWQQQVGRDTSIYWPVGLGAVGNGGVASEVQANPYSIGYTELTYTLQQHLPTAVVRNRTGNFVEPSPDSVTAAAANAAGSLPADLRFSLVDPPGEQAYPLATATWLLVYQRMPDSQKAAAVSRLLWWAIHDAQDVNPKLGYARLPPQVVVRAEALIERIEGGSLPGRP